MTTLNTYNLASVVQFKAQDCIQGIFINPALPHRFDDTANEDRPFEHMIWWGRPFIVGDDKRGWSVRCLDGGAWDRSTWLSDHAALDEAVTAAHHALLHPRHIYQATPIAGMEDAMGLTPVQW